MEPEQPNMPLDSNHSTGGAPEGRASSVALSPVLETHEEESSLEDERFADALEEHPKTESDEKKEASKRDSKIDDGFAAAPQLAEIKEQSVMQDVPVDIERPQSAVPVTCDAPNNEQSQEHTHTQLEHRDEVNKHVYPSQPVLVLLIVGLCLAVLLVSLDRTIITTVCIFLYEENI